MDEIINIDKLLEEDRNVYKDHQQLMNHQSVLSGYIDGCNAVTKESITHYKETQDEFNYERVIEPLKTTNNSYNEGLNLGAIDGNIKGKEKATKKEEPITIEEVKEKVAEEKHLLLSKKGIGTNSLFYGIVITMTIIEIGICILFSLS